MKRTYADRPNWTRVLKKSFKVKHIADKVLLGNLSIITIDKVIDPLIIQIADKKLCLANDGFIWTQYFPKNRNYALTTMFDDKHEIIELYYDICTGNKVSSSGIPYYDDLYLDVVLLPSGEIFLLDEDELKQAFKDNEISEDQYKLAYLEANNLIDYLCNNKNESLNQSKIYMEYMLRYEDKEKTDT